MRQFFSFFFIFNVMRNRKVGRWPLVRLFVQAIRVRLFVVEFSISQCAFVELFIE